MRDHIKILGTLNIIMGSLTVLAALVVLLVLGGLAGIMATDTDSAQGASFAPWMGLIGVGVAAFLTLLSLPAIIGGWGLLKFKPWSRVLMIVVSGLSLFHVPIGTALGVYGLWVLLNEQSTQLLESGGTMPPPAYQMPYQQQPQGPPPQSF